MQNNSLKAGYEYLLAYKITIPIYDYTIEFCSRSSSFSRSPRSPQFPQLSSTRTHDQMIQAARSGMQNIAEGAKQQSLAGYIKLAGISRGSLEELLNDYEAYARQHHLSIWPRERVIGEIREIREIWRILRATPTLPNHPDLPYLSSDPERALNLLITLIHQANYLIDRLVLALKEKHTRSGGLTEELHRKRKEYRGH